LDASCTGEGDMEREGRGLCPGVDGYRLKKKKKKNYIMQL